MLQVENEQSFIVEISLVTKKSIPKLDDFCLLIQINIGSQCISELLDTNSLANILQYTVNNICIPYPLKFITSYKLFIQYLLLPFIQVAIENQTYKIAMYTMPTGLFTNHQCFNMFGIQYEWTIFFIENYQFKVAIFENQKFIHNFEIFLDQQSFGEYFELLNIDQYNNFEMELVFNQINKFSSPFRSYFKLPSVKIRDKQKLINLINNCLFQIEIMISEQNYRNVRHCLKYNVVAINLNFYDQFKIRASLVEIINDRIKLILKNFYQTQSIHNQLGFAFGSIYITDQFIHDKFHVDFLTLNPCEKQFILKKISNYFKLYTQSSFKEGNDKEWKNQNLIQPIEQDFGGTHKIMILNKYRIPISFTLIGIQDRPEFIRVDLYDIENIKQNGILFFINQEQWKIKEVEPLNKGKKLKYKKEFAIQEDYYLNKVLKEKGWKVIEKLINQNSISILKEGKIHRLEQFLNWKSILEN